MVVNFMAVGRGKLGRGAATRQGASDHETGKEPPRRLSDESGVDAMTARDTSGDRMRRMSPRRRQILDTAADLFAARGFHGVSMGDIGAAVGISGPALYKHFAGKEDILGQCLLHASQRLLDGARALAATPGRDGERTST